MNNARQDAQATFNQEAAANYQQAKDGWTSLQKQLQEAGIAVERSFAELNSKNKSILAMVKLLEQIEDIAYSEDLTDSDKVAAIKPLCAGPNKAARPTPIPTDPIHDTPALQ